MVARGNGSDVAPGKVDSSPRGRGEILDALVEQPKPSLVVLGRRRGEWNLGHCRTKSATVPPATAGAPEVANRLKYRTAKLRCSTGKVSRSADNFCGSRIAVPKCAIMARFAAISPSFNPACAIIAGRYRMFGISDARPFTCNLSRTALADPSLDRCAASVALR